MSNTMFDELLEISKALSRMGQRIVDSMPLLLKELAMTSSATTRTPTAAIGARLRAARRSANLSRCETVNALNRAEYDKVFGSTWLRRVEDGEQTPHEGQIGKLCSVYAIPRAWLDAEPLAFADDDAAIAAFSHGHLTVAELKRWFRVERALALAHRNGDET